MLKSTILFIGLLTEVSHLHPELSQNDLVMVAQNMSDEPEFQGNSEIRDVIKSLKNFNPVLLKAKKAAYQKGMRPNKGGVAC